jgi:glutamate--cysteine ligase
VLRVARAGLAKRNRLDAQGRDETYFLDPLDAVVAGRTEAERLIEKFKTEWAGGVEPAFEECIY